MHWRRQPRWSCNLLIKAETRKKLLSTRSTISIKERVSAAEAAVNLFTSSSLFLVNYHIGCYFAQGKEFDCEPIIKAILHANKNCYLPVLSSDQENTLEFAPYYENDSLRFNRYKILEPDKKERICPQKLDLILLPLVGFDLKGNRLGMGGGYYDRTFSFLREKKFEKPYLLGLAYEFQQSPLLICDPWDVQLDGVLTEKHIYSFDRV